MLTETGKVVAIEGDGLWVETLKQSACAKCQAQKGCGQKLLAATSDNMSYVKAVFSKEFSQSAGKLWVVGDHVTIGIEERALVVGTFLTYLVPLLFLIIGATLASHFNFPDQMVAFFSFLSLIFGGFLVSKYLRYSTKFSDAQVVVISSD